MLFSSQVSPMTDHVIVRRARGPIDISVKPPGSKSITIRALAAAALADGRSHLYGALAADDTLAMSRALRDFGISVEAEGEPWAVDGRGGHLNSSTAEIDVNESGLSARILLMLAALSETSSTITGRGRLLERPIEPLVDVLSAQGVSVQTTDGYLPVTVNGQGGLWGGDIEVDCSKSSQFATAVLIAAPVMTEPARIRLSGLVGSTGYLDTTVTVLEAFGARVNRTITGFETEPGGYTATDYPIEPDASAAVYPMVGAAITGGRVQIDGLDMTSSQPDMLIATHLEAMGCRLAPVHGGLEVEGPESLSPIEADLSAAPDGALGLAVACAFADGPSHLTGLHSLRYKESDRLVAIAAELQKVGVDVEFDHESLRIRPGLLGAARIDPHGDHRIAMAMALVGLRIEGIEVSNPGVVSKTWPKFWAFLDELSKNGT